MRIECLLAKKGSSFKANTVKSRAREQNERKCGIIEDHIQCSIVVVVDDDAEHFSSSQPQTKDTWKFYEIAFSSISLPFPRKKSLAL